MAWYAESNASHTLPDQDRSPSLSRKLPRSVGSEHCKSKFACVAVPELKRLRALEVENAKLKRMYADLALENSAIKEVLNRKL